MEGSSIYQIGGQPGHRAEELVFVLKSVIAKQRFQGKALLIQPSDIKKYFDKEIFGPLLHVYEYDVDELDGIISYINETKFGLTMSIHSRIASFYDGIINNVNVGNIYILNFFILISSLEKVINLKRKRSILI